MEKSGRNLKNMDPRHLQHHDTDANFMDPCHPHLLFDSCQNFMDPRHPWHARRSFIHATHEPTHPRYPRYLVDSLQVMEM